MFFRGRTLPHFDSRGGSWALVGRLAHLPGDAIADEEHANRDAQAGHSDEHAFRTGDDIGDVGGRHCG